jgi:hypothetical protein
MLFLHWPANNLTHGAFRRRVLNEIAPQFAKAVDNAHLKVTLTATRPPWISLIPFQRRKLAMFSLWTPSTVDPQPYLSILNSLGGKMGGYEVSESVPVAYKRTWSARTPTPGTGLLTLLNKNPRLSYEAFMAEWFGRHTPMSIEIHPLWSYIRNVVETTFDSGAPKFDGIVEEHFRQRADLLNPLRLFGGPLHALFNMARVGWHIHKFMDLKRMQNYLVEEIYFKP